MLVLTRKVTEEVCVRIGGLELRVIVGRIRGNEVKLGFAGPEEFEIRRVPMLAASATPSGRRRQAKRERAGSKGPGGPGPGKALS